MEKSLAKTTNSDVIYKEQDLLGIQKEVLEAVTHRIDIVVKILEDNDTGLNGSNTLVLDFGNGFKANIIHVKCHTKYEEVIADDPRYSSLFVQNNIIPNIVIYFPIKKFYISSLYV